MTRDFSLFLPPIATDIRTATPTTLQRLGWQSFFSQQLSVDELERTPPVRVTSVQRSGLAVQGEGIETVVPPRADATVGDWLLYDSDRPTLSRLLERRSLFRRLAPGKDRQIQLIAANVDTAFIVSSCNQDFNVARLERYVAAAHEAGAAPVIVLTKADLTDEPSRYVADAKAVTDDVPVLLLVALGDQPKAMLAPWCGPGQTVAFLGSSGVGKSTLVNALSGRQVMATQAIREDDSRGRHTTSSRQLHVMAEGYSVLDTPGMRELQLADAADGITEVFSDLDALAAACRFSNCQHDTEPGCAVRAAMAAGEIDEGRLARWRKLVKEEAFNALSLGERRLKDRTFGRIVRSVLKNKPRKR